MQINARHRAMKSAIGSVRAEGLKPSKQTQTQLKRYASGKITAKSLKASVTGKFVNSRAK